MTTTARRPLDEYLAMQYPFNVIADEEGGYVVEFPDLPGCVTQVETLDELPAMAEDARRGWIRVAYEQGLNIPLPGRPEEYSGKFVVRLPKSLHRKLAEAAKREGVSLNQYVVALLAERNVRTRTAHGTATAVGKDVYVGRSLIHGPKPHDIEIVDVLDGGAFMLRADRDVTVRVIPEKGRVRRTTRLILQAEEARQTEQ